MAWKRFGALVLPILLSCASTRSASELAQPANQTVSSADHAAAIQRAIDAPDRLEDDRKLDAGRKPAAFLAFAGVAPGLRVAELGAGRGYTTELLARIVGPTGTVFAQNAKVILDRIGPQPWADRLARSVNRAVIRVDRDFDDPLPPEAQHLDVVLLNLFYHDTVWLKTDRARMNRAIYESLKPGGRLIVADSSAKPGTGAADAERLHRIDEELVRKEIMAAGFALESESDLFRNPDDPRDWNASPRAAGDRRGTSDRFLLKFVKP